jgi:hypothetical protein
MFQIPYLKHPIFEKQLHKKQLLQVAVFLRTALHKQYLVFLQNRYSLKRALTSLNLIIKQYQFEVLQPHYCN